MEPAIERREGALTSNRIRELSERPLRGQFDLEHLQAIHAYIFQDLPHHRPGELRGDTPGWSKLRGLEGQVGVHEVHYAHDHIEQRARAVLQELGGPGPLAALAPDAFAARMARLYGDLDFVHAFHEGNSRSLRDLHAPSLTPRAMTFHGPPPTWMPRNAIGSMSRAILPYWSARSPV